MATVTKGKTFISGETVEPADMHQLVDSATVTGIVNADIASNAAIDLSKLNLGSGITSSQIADSAVTGAAGGGKIAASAITGQTQLTDALASGDEFLVHDLSATALRRVAFNAMQPVGSVLQTVYAEDATYKTATGRMPASFAVAPLVTEGTEILTAAITPGSNSNKVLVRCCVPIITITTQSNVSFAIFRGSTCIQFSTSKAPVASDDANGPAYLEVVDSPNSLSAQTYSLRIGPTANAGYTVRLNGDTTLEYGGTAKITMTLQEIKA